MRQNKCIYCNSTDLTESDIIPLALTIKKYIRKNVCNHHNGHINREAEYSVINELSYFRRYLNIPTRNGYGDVSYPVTLIINKEKYLFENFTGLLDTIRNGSEGVGQDGKKIKLGKISDIGHESSSIIYFDKNTVIELEKSVSFKFLSSTAMLRMVAKIGYEWYCKEFNINCYQTDYHEIVNYIMREDLKKPIDTSIVQIIVDSNFYSRFIETIDPGTHILSITHDSSGEVYVIFVLWGIIGYKIKIRNSSKVLLLRSARNKFFFTRCDGSNYTASPPTLLDIVAPRCNANPKKALEEIHDIVIRNVNILFKYRLLRVNALRRIVFKIDNILNSSESNEDKMFFLLGFIDEELITALFVLISKV